MRAAHVGNLGQSLFWLVVAIVGAIARARCRSAGSTWRCAAAQEYDQSLVNTIIILPMVVTGIVIIVQNSLALAFSLAGIAGAVRFRNSLKSSGDALFILMSVGDRASRRDRRGRAGGGDQHRVQLSLRDAVADRIWRAQGHEALSSPTMTGSTKRAARARQEEEGLADAGLEDACRCRRRSQEAARKRSRKAVARLQCSRVDARDRREQRAEHRRARGAQLRGSGASAGHCGCNSRDSCAGGRCRCRSSSGGTA